MGTVGVLGLVMSSSREGDAQRFLLSSDDSSVHRGSASSFKHLQSNIQICLTLKDHGLKTLQKGLMMFGTLDW